MDELELVVQERNRLVRFSFLVSVAALALAIWARDPLLQLTTPFSGSSAGNITVGHAILIGHPVMCVMFLLLVAQIFRYANLVRQLPDRHRKHLEWRIASSSEVSRVVRGTRAICEGAKWLGMVGVPVVATFLLLISQMDFMHPDDNRKFTCQDLFSHDFNDVKPRYGSLVELEDCSLLDTRLRDACKRRNDDRASIVHRMPTLYQPYNFWAGLILQSFVFAGAYCTGVLYFGASGTAGASRLGRVAA